MVLNFSRGPPTRGDAVSPRCDKAIHQLVVVDGVRQHTTVLRTFCGPAQDQQIHQV